MTTAEPTHHCRDCGLSLATATVMGLCPACVWRELDSFGENPASSEPPGLKIIDELARGGMGVVYRAKEADAGREVAVKMLRPGLADEPGMRERFKQEARAIGALDHPGILPIYRVGEHDGLPFFTMKLAAGGSLAERRSQLAGRWREIAELLADVAGAVHHAHLHGLLHRDIKPGNILFDESGRSYVSDFGLVKIAGVESALTQSISMLGTPHYLPPEVASRDAGAASVSSDVWSLGAVLYELLAGRPPFHAEGIVALLRSIVEENPAPLPPVPRDLGTIAFKCLAKDPSDRYLSADALAGDLHAWLAGRPIAACPTTLAERATAWTRRNPALAVLGILFAAAIMLGVILTWRNNQVLEQALTAALTHADASRHAGRPGQRQQTLDALARIAALRPTSEVREQAITTLALPDVRELHRLPFVDGKPPLVDGDFRRAAALEPDGRVRIRNLRTGATVTQSPEFELKLVEVAAFSPDGRSIIARAENRALYVWHADASGWVGLNEPAARHAVISPDSASVALAANDSDELIVRNLSQPADSPPVAIIATGWKGSEPLAWSPDGSRIAVGTARGHEHEVQIFEVASGVCERVLSNPLGTVNRVSWMPDGNGIAVTGGWFDALTWRFDLPPPQWTSLRGHSLIAQSVAYSPEGGLVATLGRDWTIRLWDTAANESMLMLPASGQALAFSQDGRKLLFEHAGIENCVICEVTPSEVCRQIRTPVPLSGNVYGSYCAEFSPDGSRLAVADWGGVYLFDVATARPTGRILTGYANTLHYSSKDTLMVGGVGYFESWRLDSAPPSKIWTASIQTPSPRFYRMAQSADHTWLAVSERNAIHIFRGKENDRQPARTIAAPLGVEFNPIALSPDGKTLVASAANRPGVWVWDVPSGVLRAELSAGRQYAYACFTDRGGSLWLHDATSIRRFDTATLTARQTIPRLAPGSGNSLLSVSPDGRLLAASLDATSVSLLDSANGQTLARLVHPRPRNIQWIAFNYDASKLAVCVGGHVVQLWDLKALRSNLQVLGLDWDAPR